MPEEEQPGLGYERPLRDAMLQGNSLPTSNIPPDEEYDELLIDEEEKQSSISQWTVRDKVTAALGGLGTMAATWGAFPSAEGSPIKPYDGLIFFGGIVCVITAAGIVGFSAWKNEETPSTYSGEEY